MRVQGVPLHREREQTRSALETPNGSPFVKDAFHDYVVAGRKDAVIRKPSPRPRITSSIFRPAIGDAEDTPCFGMTSSTVSVSAKFDVTFTDRIARPMTSLSPAADSLNDAEKLVARQA